MSSYGAVLPAAARGILSSCRLPPREKSIAPLFAGFQQVRGVKSKNNPQAKGKGKKETKTDRRGPREFRQKNLKDMEQYALCDAMRYVSVVWPGRLGDTLVQHLTYSSFQVYPCFGSRARADSIEI